MDQNAGEKGRTHDDPGDPPRRRANKVHGHGTFAGDRPPVAGVVGRGSGHLRLAVVERSDRATPEGFVTTFDFYSGEGLPGNGPNWGCSGKFRGIFGDCSNGQTTGLRDCTDGSSNTLLVGENSPNMNGSLLWVNGDGTYATTVIPLNWKSTLKDGESDPSDGTTCDINTQLNNSTSALRCWRNQTVNYGFKSWHPGGANFAMADGSVKFIKQTISARIYNALGSKAGGEVISADAY